VRVVPRQRIEKDIVGLVAAGEDTREQNPVVVPAVLVDEDADAKPIAAAAGEYILDQSRAGHPIADDDEMFFGAHAGFESCAAAARTAQTLNSGISLVGSSAALVRRFADCAPPQ